MEKTFSKIEVKKKEIVILFSIIIFLVFGYVAGSLKWIQDFQLILDLLSGIFAFFIGTLALVRFYTKKNSFNYLLLGLGFVTVAVIDVLQILLELNIFTDLFSVRSGQLFPNSIVLSRFFLSLIFFLSWIFMREEHRERKLNERVVLILTTVVFSAFVVIVTFFSKLFASFEEYTFAITMQLISLCIYCLTLFGYLRSRGIYFRNFDFWLIFSITFGILSQIFFLPFLNIEYYLMINLSTFAKFLSYAILLVGFLYSVYEMYKSEEIAQKELLKKNLALSETKKKVEEAYMILRKEKWQLTKENEKNTADQIMKDILKNT